MIMIVPPSDGSASSDGTTGMQSVKASRPDGSAPIVVALRPPNCVTAVAPPTATSADGIFGWMSGESCIVATTPSARAQAAGLAEPRPETTATRPRRC